MPNPAPHVIPAAGTPGGPCDSTARDARVLALAYRYGRALACTGPGPVETPSRIHAELYTTTNADECEHVACRHLRRRAAKLCGLCAKPLGFNAPLLVADADHNEFVHEACFDAKPLLEVA